MTATDPFINFSHLRLVLPQ